MGARLSGGGHHLLQIGLDLRAGDVLVRDPEAQFPALSIRRVFSTFSSQPISISGTDFRSRSV